MKVCNLLERQQNNIEHYIRDNIESINYAEWHRRSTDVAGRISELGICNESVVVFLPNSVQYAVAYFGILYSSNVIVPIDIRAQEPEIESTVTYCEAKLIITDVKHYVATQYAINRCIQAIAIYVMDMDQIVMPNKKKSYLGGAHYDFLGEDIILMLHTSGTTNDPKRVMLTNDNLINNVESNISSLQLTEKDVVLIMLPMCFGYCNTAQFLTHLYLGADIVIYNHVFFAKEFFETVKKHNITCFTAIPYMLYKLLAYQGKKDDSSSLRYICFGGSKINTEKLRLLIKRYPEIGFVHTYGQTECAPRLTALMPKDSISKIGSVGTPIPGVHIAIEKDGCIINLPMIVGEVLVQGKNVMKGYYKQKLKTEQVLINGWLHTGDLGFIDEDGYLYITGRIKNIIISGGQNLYPEEIEEIILTHCSVKEVCVYGKYHELLGEVPVADVVMSEPEKVHELPNYLVNKLANYKIPMEFNVVEKINKTYNGKIIRPKCER